jgi:hypothetical protein
MRTYTIVDLLLALGSMALVMWLAVWLFITLSTVPQ